MSLIRALGGGELPVGLSVVGIAEVLHSIGFRLEHKPTDRYTDQDESDMEYLRSELESVLGRMRSQAAIHG